jgi:ribosome-binding protein aMBF1 (putative translation factor)
MATELQRQLNKADPQEAAFVMAFGIICDRVKRLSAEDRDDLYALVKELPGVQTQEDLQAIQTAMMEILDQKHLTVHSADLSDENSRPEKLQRWVDHVSARIRELRTQRGWTQEDLAKKSNLPQSHISRLEAGKHSPSSMTLEKLAKAFDVNIGELDPSHN